MHANYKGDKHATPEFFRGLQRVLNKVRKHKHSWISIIQYVTVTGRLFLSLLDNLLLDTFDSACSRTF